MTETELKFQIPDDRLAAVQQAMAGPGARQVRLRARYFDTPDRRLAGAAMALRLRLEGDRWVQTLKGRGDGMLRRLEHEVVLDGADPAVVPALDLSHHDGTPAGAALRRALGDAADRLACRYETDVMRTLDRVEHGGATIERALDLGEIRAGSARWPLQELEFELLDGPVQGLLDLANKALDPCGLWLDVRSKAERGERLASGLLAGPAHPAPGPDGASTVAAHLAALLANIADLADPRCAGAPRESHAQQLHAGLRALQAALLAGGESALAAAVDTLARQLSGPGLSDDTARLAALRDAHAQSLWLALLGLMARSA